MTPHELLAKHNISLKSYAPGRYYTTCPKCSHTRSKPHQKSPVLGVTIGDNGSVCWGCNHCTWSGPAKASGERQPRELTSHIYRDKDGVVRFRKVRNLPGREPRFWLEQPDGRGGWRKGTKGVDTKILYRLDEVRKAIADGRTIACVEGEKDADNLWRIGIAATCNAHGASEPGKQPKWSKRHSEQLADADIVVFNDNDAAGYAHAEATCKLSLGIAKRVRRLDVAPHWPDMPKGADVSDWLNAGRSREELEALIVNAPDYAPSDPPTSQSQQDRVDDADIEIHRLAKLPPVEYERQRKASADKLGMRASMLDRVVRDERARLGLKGDGLQGHAVSFAEPELWPEPVDGAALLDDIAEAIRRHVVLPDHSRDAATLWVAHTYLLDQLMITPRLAIRSPVKGCGKTTLLDVIGELVYRPLPNANCTASTIFRVVEGHRPTLLIDEADSFLHDNEELRGILNSGHRRGGAVLRNVGDEHEPRAFSTYAACAIALIGQLPGTLADRSVTIELTRRKASEPVEAFRFDRVEHLTELARKLARWTKDNVEAIAATEPQMPAGLYNRAADNWRPLMAIATVAAGDWLARGHRAALAGAVVDVDEASRLELLLGDIRDIFEARATEAATKDKDRISSAELIEKLVEIVPRPWGEYGKSGKPLTQNKLARLLKPLGINPQVLRIGTGKTPSGYYWHQFEEACDRFLPPTGGFKPQHLNKCDGTGTSAAFRTSTAEKDVEVRKCEKSNNDGPCLGVEDREGESPSARASIPFMLTQEVKRRLRICGYSDADIAHFTPQQAHEILAEQGWQLGA
jgi:hypothetical protein